MVKLSKSGPGPTGPRTPQGKAKSNHNALKHGVFSKVAVLKGFHAAAVPEDVRKQNGSPSVEECKQYFLDELEQEQKRLERYQEKKASIESDRMKLESLCRNVPDPPRLDRLLRYAASLERTFDRTVNQLERAQRVRRGQPVPAPISVNVSSA